MNDSFARPCLLVSRCLGFAACRWNGLKIDEPLVEDLKPYVDFIDVCPECGIGLGVPRHPIRLVSSPEGVKLFQPATGDDLTLKMQEFSKNFISALGPLDGAILKFKSPSCGLSNVKLHRAIDKGECAGKAEGLFGFELKKAHPELPAEDEGRLRNFLIREHFLTRVFLRAELRAVAASGRMASLVNFHSRCKYLLMAYSQTGLRKLGNIVARGADKDSLPSLFEEYSREFSLALSTAPRPGSAVNVLQHMMGHFSKDLSVAERSYFLDVLEDYLRGGAPSSVALGVLKSWAIRFEEKYILSQHFLRPYPDSLVCISDSGKGRDF